MSRQNQWFVSGDGIANEVIAAHIQRYLGPDALCRPGIGIGEYEGQPGYVITAYRTLTSQMIQDLKEDSSRWLAEKELHVRARAVRQQITSHSATNLASSFHDLRSPASHESMEVHSGESDGDERGFPNRVRTAPPATFIMEPQLPFQVFPNSHHLLGSSEDLLRSDYGATRVRSSIASSAPTTLRDREGHAIPKSYNGGLLDKETVDPVKIAFPQHVPSFPPTTSLSPQPFVKLGTSSFDAEEIERSQTVLGQTSAMLNTSAEEVAYTCGWQVNGVRFFETEAESRLEHIRHLGTGGAGAFSTVDEVRVLFQEFEILSDPQVTLARKKIRINKSPKWRRLEELDMVKNEVQNLQKASHLHIVRVIGTFSEESQYHELFACILVYPVGRDLHQFLRAYKTESRQSGKQGPNRLWIKKWFGCLASALAYMHQNGIQHKDIKPRNIIHKGEHIYFTDFSSSRNFVSGHTSTDTPARATQLYRAPEQSESTESLGLQRHGKESDVFSLGLVFVELLTVLVGMDVDGDHGLREYVDPYIGSGEDTGLRSQGEYWRAVDSFQEWFAPVTDWEEWEGQQMFVKCVRPMLALDRKSRPSASGVRNLVLRHQPWQRTLACPCRDSL